jgi:CubicO group peptidase (beta-lactamase class C family)
VAEGTPLLRVQGRNPLESSNLSLSAIFFQMKRSSLFLALPLLTSITFTANAESFHEKLDAIRKKHQLPGLAAALVIDRRFVELEATGVRKTDSNEALRKDDVFHLGSCTKAMTATLAALLIDEKKLNWNDSLEKLLPNIQLHPDFKSITFEELLTHRSGLIANPDDTLTEKIKNLPVMDARAKLANELLSKKQNHPAKKYLYSNAGYIIAGHILEKITGKLWEKLMIARLFKPLGMKSCGFGATPWGHTIRDQKIVSAPYDNFAFYGPAGTVHCTLKDWVRFLEIHVDENPGAKTFLKAETIKKLHTPAPGTDKNYTYGGWVVVIEDKLLAHEGSNTFNHATVWLGLKKKAILISTTNIFSEKTSAATNEAIDLMARTHLKSPNTP